MYFKLLHSVCRWR